MLSSEPNCKDPSLFCAPGSPAPVELLNTSPLPKVCNVKGAAPPSTDAIVVFDAPVKEPDTTLVIRAVLPPCSK